MDEESKQAMPQWQKAPPELVQAFNEMVGPLPGVEVRKMFGYPAAFFQGQMFASLFADNMIVRLPDDERARLLAVEGASPFEPMPGRPAIWLPVCMKQMAGSWLMASVCIERMKHMSSTICDV